MMKTDKNNCLTIIRKRTSVPRENLGQHLELDAPFINKGGEPQTRTPNMLLVGSASRVCTRAHDNKVGVLTCPRLM